MTGLARDSLKIPTLSLFTGLENVVFLQVKSTRFLFLMDYLYRKLEVTVTSSMKFHFFFLNFFYIYIYIFSYHFNMLTSKLI